MHPGAVRIRSAAAALGLRQLEIAQELGVTPSTAHRWWHGEREPSPENCSGLEGVLHLEQGELFFAYYAPPGWDPKVEVSGDGSLLVRLRATPGYLKWAV